MTKLNPTNLFAVEVPMDAEKIKISGLNWLCVFIKGRWTAWEELHNKFEILGEVTKDEISFNPKIYLNRENINQIDVFEDYINEGKYFFSSYDSFRSLLQSNGLEFKGEFKYVILKPI